MATRLTETVKAKKYVLNKHIWNITILPSDLELVEEELPPLKDEEYLVEAELFSIDINYLFMKEIHEMGSTMIGFQLAKIVESKNPNFPVGKRIVGFLGWRTHTIIDPYNNKDMLDLPPYFVEEINVIPLPLNLGMLGPLGNMAYFSLMEIKPIHGETIVISNADHSVAIYVGQIAKIMGLKVIGLCQSDNWAQTLKKLGFDEVIIVATDQKYTETLKNLTDKGIDCFYDLDSVFTSATIMYNMNSFGRVALYGGISNSHENRPVMLSDMQLPTLMNQLKMDGFNVSRWYDRREEGIQQNLQWFCEEKLRSVESVYSKSFENMLEIFDEVLHKRTFGPVIVGMEQSTTQILLCDVTFV